jgi:hypothetical protein
MHFRDKRENSPGITEYRLDGQTVKTKNENNSLPESLN